VKAVARLSTDLENPALIRLLKMEAHTTLKAVLSTALEAYFAHRLETKALARLSQAVFEEWNGPRDAEFDRL